MEKRIVFFTLWPLCWWQLGLFRRKHPAYPWLLCIGPWNWAWRSEKTKEKTSDRR